MAFAAATKDLIPFYLVNHTMEQKVFQQISPSSFLHFEYKPKRPTFQVSYGHQTLDSLALCTYNGVRCAPADFTSSYDPVLGNVCLSVCLSV